MSTQADLGGRHLREGGCGGSQPPADRADRNHDRFLTDGKRPTARPCSSHRPMRRTHLPISSPCHEDWDAMDRVERGRFCGQCDKQVFDLSSMTEREAKGVLAEHAGARICVRYCHGSDGAIRFRPEAPARAAAVLAVALAACTPHEGEATMGEPRPVQHEEMGKIEVVTPAEPEPEPLMGAVEVVPPEPEPKPDAKPQPTPPIEVKGDVAVPPTAEVMGELAPPDEPCDTTPPPATPRPAVPGLQKL